MDPTTAGYFNLRTDIWNDLPVATSTWVSTSGTSYVSVRDLAEGVSGFSGWVDTVAMAVEPKQEVKEWDT
jgi:hypothetical protein